MVTEEDFCYMAGKEWFINTYLRSNFLNSLSAIIGKRHLDVGCGNGYLTYFIAKKFPETLVTGIDIKPAVKYKAKNLSIKKVPANNHWALSKKFDSCTLCFVLHEASDTKIILTQVHKALKYMGKAIIIDYKRAPQKIFKKFFKCKNEKFHSEYIEHNKFGLKEYKEMFSRHNFRVKKIEYINPIILCIVIERRDAR